MQWVVARTVDFLANLFNGCSIHPMSLTIDGVVEPSCRLSVVHGQKLTMSKRSLALGSQRLSSKVKLGPENFQSSQTVRQIKNRYRDSRHSVLLKCLWALRVHEPLRDTTVATRMATTVVAATYGALAEFDPEKDTVKSYTARAKVFFKANSIAEGKQAAIFLSCIGARTYDLLESLLAPASPG